MPAPSTDDQIAHALLRIPGVRAVLLGGSRATGVADAASDTDLYALRSGPPAPEGAPVPSFFFVLGFFFFFFNFYFFFLL